MNEYEIAYGNAYDLSLKKQFSKPKIYTAKGDLNKWWYVYFSYRDPDSVKLVRQIPFYGNANTYKTKDERMAVLAIYRNIINKYLRAGLSPYGDNAEKIHEGELINESVTLKDSIPVPSLETERPKENLMDEMTVKEAFNSVLDIKRKQFRESSLRSYGIHVKLFKEWLEKKHDDIQFLSQITKKTVFTFLNDILGKTSARNRNNYRASLSSWFETLVDNEMIATNFVKSIKKLKTKPTESSSFFISRIFLLLFTDLIIFMDLINLDFKNSYH